MPKGCFVTRYGWSILFFSSHARSNVFITIFLDVFFYTKKSYYYLCIEWFNACRVFLEGLERGKN